MGKGGKVYLQLTSLARAREILLDAWGKTTLTSEEVPLDQALGRTLAAPAAARLSSPAFHGAAMDGVALLASDTFGASERRPVCLRIGHNAHWINTGQPLPAGCNAVVMLEEVIPMAEADGHETIMLEKSAFPWQHVRKLGEDLVATEIILPAGILIGPYELGALAAAGVLRPLVWQKPLVVIIPSGSELAPLAEIDEELLAQGRQLPEFNSLILHAMVCRAGGQPRIEPIVPDEAGLILKALKQAAESPADLIIINAGSSAGSKDYTAQSIAALGELWVHGVAMMPGKPTALGSIAGKPVIGLPGYPVSAILAFEQLVEPLLAQWQRRAPTEPIQVSARPFQALPSRPGMEEFIRVKLGWVNDKLVAIPLPRGAGTVSSLSRADGIIRVPAASEGLPAGQPAPVTLIRPRSQLDQALLIIGSHDNSLDLLDSLLRQRRPGRSLTSAHVGSLGGLLALKNGMCHMAGSHLLGQDGVYNQDAVRQHLSGVAVHMVRLAEREQGMIVPAGNPQAISSLADLARPEVTFINRQRGSGTRLLLDWRLRRLGISAATIKGYEDEEYTHMNVAAAVLSGLAGVGLGVKAAAQALNLDFIPVGVEEYDLVILSRYWEDEKVRDLLQVVGSDEFKNALLALGGYGVEKTGQLIWRFAG